MILFRWYFFILLCFTYLEIKKQMKKNLILLSCITLLSSAVFVSSCKKDPKDTTSPILTMYGPTTMYWQQGKSYADMGCSANDDKDGTVAVTSTGNVNPDVVGTYTIIYTAKDEAENSVTASRTVKVVNFDGKYDLVQYSCSDTSRNTVPTHPDSSIVTAINIPTYYDLTISNFARRPANIAITSFMGTSNTVLNQPAASGGTDQIEGQGSISGMGIGTDKLKLTFHFKEINSIDSLIQGTAVFTHR